MNHPTTETTTTQASATRHTPLPWHTNENGLARNAAGETQWTIGPSFHCIATVHRRTDDGAQMEADAKFIVRACNSHAALVAALEAACNRLSSAADAFDKSGNEWMAGIYCQHANEARAALAAAKEGTQ